jgi:hypothetical protein
MPQSSFNSSRWLSGFELAPIVSYNSRQGKY